MGKDLKGKELGVGISQRKDGLYTARFTDRHGRRKQAYFKKLQDCRNWLADAIFEDEHGNVLFSENPTVDAWFNYWMENVKGNNIRYNTVRTYQNAYNWHVKPTIGNMLIKDVKPLICQNILNSMAIKHTNSTISRTRLLMYSIFDSAVENEIIAKNPITKNVKCTSGRKSKDVRALTIEEQKKFLEAAKGSDDDYNPWAFILQTGLRTGEMAGLQWKDVDLKKRVIHINRTMEYRYEEHKWASGLPKTSSSIRDVPLTQEAVNILNAQKNKDRELKIIPLEFSDIVFLSKKGKPRTDGAYNRKIYQICDDIGIKRFSMHVLRHTYATRCIEAGMKPKTLQMILGHSNIAMTMDLYVDVTDDEKIREIENVEYALKLV